MSEMGWPIAIAVGLLVVVAVNGAFAWVAVREAPLIEASYTSTVDR